jgi:hypothetical protein
MNKKLNAGRKESVKTSAHWATELLKVHPYKFITYKTLSSSLGRKKQVLQPVAIEGGHWIYDLEFLFFSYEEWFALNGHVNGQNNIHGIMKIPMRFKIFSCKIMVLVPF